MDNTIIDYGQLIYHLGKEWPTLTLKTTIAPGDDPNIAIQHMVLNPDGTLVCLITETLGHVAFETLLTCFTVSPVALPRASKAWLQFILLFNVGTV